LLPSCAPVCIYVLMYSAFIVTEVQDLPFIYNKKIIIIWTISGRKVIVQLSAFI